MMKRLIPLLLTVLITPGFAAAPPSASDAAKATTATPTGNSDESDSDSDKPVVPAEPTEVVAPAPCKKPMIKSNNIRKADDNSEAELAFDTYSECVKAYADLQSRDSQAHVQAGNKAIEDYNKVVQQKKAASGDN
jgi:hypothetical protein